MSATNPESSLAPSPTKTNNPYTQTSNPFTQNGSDNGGYGIFGGGSPPSIYLICFVVIICVLIIISSLLALRTIRHRRRLHRAWAATGYNDSFFDSAFYRENAPRGGHSAAARWGMLNSMHAARFGKSDKSSALERPKVWEIDMCSQEDENEDGPATTSHSRDHSMASEKGKAKAIEYDTLGKSWDRIMPISTSLLLPPPPPVAESDPSAAIRHNPPTFWATVRTVPVRPPPPPPAPVPEPMSASDALSTPTFPTGEPKELEVGVLIAFPMEEGWDRSDRDDGEQELPDVALGVSTVRLDFNSRAGW